MQKNAYGVLFSCIVEKNQNEVLTFFAKCGIITPWGIFPKITLRSTYYEQKRTESASKSATQR